MKERLRDVTVVHAALVVATITALYPLVSIAALALNRPGERVSGLTLPDGIHFGNFQEAWTRGLFDRALLSSAIVAVAVVVVSIVLAGLAAYAFAHLRFPGKPVVFGLLLVGLVLPYESLVIPLFYDFRSLGLLDTRWALILPQIGLSVSFGTFWLRTAFEAQPQTLIDAARVDGASEHFILARIVVPLARPALLTLAALLFLFTWNEFLLALVLVPQNQDVQTAPLSLSFFAGNRRTGDPAVTAAAALIVAAPVTFVYLFLQRHFARGLTAGAVKE